jgi:hypothetical protein
VRRAKHLVEIRAQHGNVIVIKAFKAGNVQFPDGKLPRCIGIVFRRKKSWTIHFPVLNLSSSAPP